MASSLPNAKRYAVLSFALRKLITMQAQVVVYYQAFDVTASTYSRKLTYRSESCPWKYFFIRARNGMMSLCGPLSVIL